MKKASVRRLRLRARGAQVSAQVLADELLGLTLRGFVKWGHVRTLRDARVLQNEIRIRVAELFRLAGVRACFFCGCTAEHPCSLDDDGATCSWIGPEQCSAAACAGVFTRPSAARRKQ